VFFWPMSAARATVPLAAAFACAALLTTAGPAEAKVTSSHSGRVLTVTGGKGADRVRVTCADGVAKVNGKDVGGGPIGCAKIVEIDAGTGDGNDVIDFSGVTGEFGEARFPGFGVATGSAAVTGAGNDRFIPSPASFNLFYGEDGDDRAFGGPARDIISGGAGDDSLVGANGRDSVIGNAGNDHLVGGAGADLLSGNTGDDRLNGGAGADILGGGPGRDRLMGGPGRDRLVGGPGMDVLRGGPGKDDEAKEPEGR
jgi:Ca2+-binding RTX toxin-like protein